VEVNQTLQDVWPSPGMIHYVYIIGFSCPSATCKIDFASKYCVLLYWQRYCTALDQWASAKLCGVVQGMELRNFLRGRHLYSAGRPSRWASAHILVNAYYAVHMRKWSIDFSFKHCNRLRFGRVIVKYVIPVLDTVYFCRYQTVNLQYMS